MNLKDYRKQLEEQVAAQTSGTDTEKNPSSASTEALAALVAVLADHEANSKARMNALTRLEALSFSVEAFANVQAHYLAALRVTAQSEDDALRECATASLAQNGDRSAQTALVEGLRDPSKATLPPEVALQLLSHDIHAEVYAVAREILDKPPNEDAKVEAIRLLASDSESEETVTRVLRSKTESVEARLVAAAALQSLSITGFCEQAVEVVADEDDDDDVRTGVLVGLAQTDDFMSDDEVRGRVQKVHDETKSETIKRQTKTQLDRTGGEDAKARYVTRKNRRRRGP